MGEGTRQSVEGKSRGKSRGTWAAGEERGTERGGEAPRRGNWIRLGKAEGARRVESNEETCAIHRVDVSLPCLTGAMATGTCCSCATEPRRRRGGRASTAFKTSASSRRSWRARDACGCDHRHRLIERSAPRRRETGALRAAAPRCACTPSAPSVSRRRRRGRRDDASWPVRTTDKTRLPIRTAR